MPTPSILALDVGEKRIGLAIASLSARLPRPLVTLDNTEDFWPSLADIVEKEAVKQLVVGYPRGLQGQATAQTALVEAFASRLAHEFATLTISLQDETLTSKKAEAELGSRGKPFKPGDIDALAATYILEDYFISQPPFKTV